MGIGILFFRCLIIVLVPLIARALTNRIAVLSSIGLGFTGLATKGLTLSAFPGYVVVVGSFALALFGIIAVIINTMYYQEHR